MTGLQGARVRASRHSRAKAFDAKGFNLIELLIVMSVLAILLAIVVPSVERAMSLARRAVCATNFAHVSDAYATLKTDAQMRTQASWANPPSAGTWPGALYPYLEFHDAHLACPEDDAEVYKGDAFKMHTTAWGDRTFDPFNQTLVKRDGDGNITADLFLDPVWERMNMGEAWDLYEQGLLQTRPENIWKMNEEDYAVKRDEGFPMYTPGENPDVFWFVFEDGGDGDFFDFDVRVEQLATGAYMVEAWHHNAVAWHHLVGPDGTEYRVFDHSGPFYFADPPTSYGANSKILGLHPGARKILAIDYENIMVRVGDDLGADPEYAGWDTYVAARHLGRVNVLHADRSVATARPEALNPEDPGNQERIEADWLPD